MGYFWPTLLAFILNSCGVYIFHDAGKAGCEPLVSSLVFLFGIFLMLWDLDLFPTTLRALWRCGALIMHFLFAAFIMEHIMNDFWFPLEASLFSVLPKIADYEASVLQQFGWRSPGILQFLKCDITQVVASYMMSVFFFLSVLHATRLIDLRLLSCGREVFLEDLSYRVRKALRKLYRRLTKKQNTVKFQSFMPMEVDFCATDPPANTKDAACRCRRKSRRTTQFY